MYLKVFLSWWFFFRMPSYSSDDSSNRQVKEPKSDEEGIISNDSEDQNEMHMNQNEL